MFRPSVFLTALLCLLLAGESTLSFAAVVTANSTEPAIRVVRGRVVVVDAPAGFASVKLQVLTSPLKGKPKRGQKPPAPEWKTVASKLMNGEAGVVRFVVPKLTARRNMRVYGLRPGALPESLLTGATSFAPDEGEPSTGNGGAITTHGGTLTLSNSNTASLSADGLASKSPERTVEESDIWKVAGNRLYFYNSTRGLQSFDITNPDDPGLLGTLPLPGAGEEMYLLDDNHVVLLKNKGYGWLYWGDWNWRWGGGIITIGGGSVISRGIMTTSVLTLADTSTAAATTSTAALTKTGAGTLQLDASNDVVASSGIAATSSLGLRIWPYYNNPQNEVLVADVSAGAPRQIASVPYDGSLLQSRLIGNVLYLATNTYSLDSTINVIRWGTQISSVDLTDPAHPVLRDSEFLGGWTGAVYATDQYFYVASSAYPDSIVCVLDISDPTGVIVRAGDVSVPGQINDKFKMHQSGDTFTVVTGVWRWDEATSRMLTRNIISTYSLADPKQPVALGSLEVSPGQWLYATRFDGDRLYVVTAVRTDPLHIIDLSDPARPTELGQLEVPGFSTYIEPLGDRLVTIGFVAGRPSIALYDVSDATQPKQLSTVTPGADDAYVYSEAAYNEKAFTVLPEQNIILLPIQSNNYYYSVPGTTGVQIIDLLRNELKERGVIAANVNPRRATLERNRIFSISATNLLVVDATDRDHPVTTANLQIAWPVDEVLKVGNYLVEISRGYYWSNIIPEVNITPVDNPENVLANLPLSKLPVVGATVRAGVLYVFQAAQNYYDANVDAQARLKLTTIDVSRLPEVKVLGETAIGKDFTTYIYNTKPLWVNDRTLIFAAEGGKSWGGYYPRAFVKAGEADSAALWPGYYYWSWGRTQELIAFDVSSPAQPKLASRLTFGEEQAWDVTTPLAANDTVYLGFKMLPFYRWAEGEEGKPLPADVAEQQKLIHRHFLKLIDYSDSANPVLALGKVNLPGELRALSRQGQLLYTVGRTLSTTDGNLQGTGSSLHVSGFDGKAAHLLDQLPIDSYAHPFAVSGEQIFVLHGQPPFVTNYAAAADEPAQSEPAESKATFESLTVNEETGKFTRVGLLTCEREVAFSLVDSVAVLRNYYSDRNIRLVDLRDPAKLLDLGTFELQNNGSANLQLAAADPDLGLWIPLGAYGVEAVLLPKGAE